MEFKDWVCRDCQQQFDAGDPCEPSGDCWHDRVVVLTEEDRRILKVRHYMDRGARFLHPVYGIAF